MNIREEIIQHMYEMMNKENLCKDVQGEFIDMMKLCAKYFPEEKEDDYMNGIFKVERAAFFAGANMILDFISGKEVQ